MDVPTYTDNEYNQHLKAEGWSREETDHLMDLARRFDLRFIIMADRYDVQKFPKRSVEDIKDRYYKICGILGKVIKLFVNLLLPYTFNLKISHFYAFCSWKFLTVKWRKENIHL